MIFEPLGFIRRQTITQLSQLNRTVYGTFRTITFLKNHFRSLLPRQDELEMFYKCVSLNSADSPPQSLCFQVSFNRPLS